MVTNLMFEDPWLKTYGVVTTQPSSPNLHPLPLFSFISIGLKFTHNYNNSSHLISMLI